MRVTDIVWDTDGVSIDDLPDEVIYPADTDQEEIADMLSDEHGYCVKSFSVDTYPVKLGDLIEGDASGRCREGSFRNETIDLCDYKSLAECIGAIGDLIEADEAYSDAEYNICGIWRKERDFTDEDAKYAASLGYEECWFMNHFISDEKMRDMNDDELSDALKDVINKREALPEDDGSSWDAVALDELYLKLDGEIQARKGIIPTDDMTVRIKEQYTNGNYVKMHVGSVVMDYALSSFWKVLSNDGSDIELQSTKGGENGVRMIVNDETTSNTFLLEEVRA